MNRPNPKNGDRPRIRVIAPLRSFSSDFPSRLKSAVAKARGAVVLWPGLERQSRRAADAFDQTISDAIERGSNVSVCAFLGARAVSFPEPAGPSLGERHGRLELILPAVTPSVGRIRRIVQRVAGDLRLGESDQYDFGLAVCEALTNALQHGSPRGSRDVIAVRLSLYSGGLVAQVLDRGSWARGPERGEAHAPNGRGLGIMSALVDEVRVESVHDGTLVSLYKHSQASP